MCNHNYHGDTASHVNLPRENSRSYYFRAIAGPFCSPSVSVLICCCCFLLLLLLLLFVCLGEGKLLGLVGEGEMSEGVLGSGRGLGFKNHTCTVSNCHRIAAAQKNQ